MAGAGHGNASTGLPAILIESGQPLFLAKKPWPWKLSGGSGYYGLPVEKGLAAGVSTNLLAHPASRQKRPALEQGPCRGLGNWATTSPDALHHAKLPQAARRWRRL